jgi:hypothetical protein
MQCQRLFNQIKTWYIHVQNETMAPARMISFIENHASQCDICQADPHLQEEIIQITKIILPESMIPKAVRSHHDFADEEEVGEEEIAEEKEGEEKGEEEEDENELELFDPDDEI